MTRRDGASGYDQPTARSCCKRCDVALDFGGVPQIDRARFNAERRRRRLDRTILAEPGGSSRIPKDCDAIYFRCNLLKQVQPFSADAVFEKGEAGGVATRSRKAIDIAGSDGIGNVQEYDGHGAGYLHQWPQTSAASSHDNFRRKSDQFRRVLAHLGIIASPTGVDPKVAPVSPAQLLHALQERREAGLSGRLVLREVHQHADVPSPLALLRPR